MKQLLGLLMHCVVNGQVGGLGDVVTSLAKAHQATGTLVEIVMPKYDCSNYRCVLCMYQQRIVSPSCCCHHLFAGHDTT